MTCTNMNFRTKFRMGMGFGPRDYVTLSDLLEPFYRMHVLWVPRNIDCSSCAGETLALLTFGNLQKSGVLIQTPTSWAIIAEKAPTKRMPNWQ